MNCTQCFQAFCAFKKNARAGENDAKKETVNKFSREEKDFCASNAIYEKVGRNVGGINEPHALDTSASANTSAM